MVFHTWLHLYVYNVGSALGGVETAINNHAGNAVRFTAINQ